MNTELSIANGLELAEAPEWAVAMADDTRGKEAIDSSDIILSTIRVANALSEVVTKNNPKYIKGCESGDLYLANDPEGRFYKDGLSVVIVKSFKIFRVNEVSIESDQKKSVPIGYYESLKEASDNMSHQLELNKTKNLEIDTISKYIVLIIDQNSGEVFPAELSLYGSSKTQAYFAKVLNTLLASIKGASFLRVIKLTTKSFIVDRSTHYVFDAQIGGFVSEQLFSSAEKLYTQLSSGEVSI